MSTADLQARRDKLVVESDALQSELDIAVSQLRRIDLLRRIGDVRRAYSWDDFT